jgi:uncharacterized protein
MTTSRTDMLRTLRGGRLVIAIVVGLVLVAIVARALTALYVEVLWQSQAGYLPVFWRRLAWEWGTRAFAGATVAALVYVNLKVASTTLGGIQIRRRFGNLEISEQIPRRYVTWAMLTAATVLGLWFGASVSAGIGRQVLHAFSARPWGLAEPILGRDVGFYVFWFPVLGSAVTYALIVAFLVFTLATAGYAATGALTWMGGRLRAHDLARMHLGVILTSFFVLLAVRLWLGRYGLLLNGSSGVQGIFGFTDAQARLPALQTLTVISIGAGAATFWGAWKNRPWPILGAFTAIFLGSVLIGNVYPALIQSFRVEPNELERETPYILHSLEFTRRGFGLADLERRTFDYEARQPVDWRAAGEQFAGLPVWGPSPLLTTYREREALFPYYDFDHVAIDRYRTDDAVVPMAISVRQVDRSGIQDPNWQNLHLRERYVAGMGAVASIATTRTPEGRPELVVRGIPPVVASSSVGRPAMALERPQIYFGTRAQQDYAVVTPGPDQYLAPDGTPGEANVDFPGGIRLSSGLRTLLLAWHFGATNLLFSSEINEDSRLIHRRTVIERALAVAPFLRFPEDPYPVVTRGRIVWVLEGFTGTAAYPLSSVHDLGSIRPMVAYARNSIKVTVDAVTGELRLYRVPVDDPIADAYQTAYPGLIVPIEDMPSELREHLRYPRSLLDLQSRVLLQYHQETPAAFHGQQDVWREPQELSNAPTPVPYEPEYAIYRLPGESEARFQLTALFVPAGRDNLTAILVARTDDAGVPETILIDVPVDDQVLGPRLIEAQVEQDPQISQQFTLWRTGGSEVWTGHLHLVPVGNRILYMEPIFLAAEEDAIPEMRRFVVSDGSRVVMAETLQQAADQLAGGAATEFGTTGVAGDLPTETPTTPADATGWPTAALELLEQAEARAREGDWRGYGEALDALRALLRRLGAAGG